MNGDTNQPFCNCKHGYTTGDSGEYCAEEVISPLSPSPQGKPYNCMYFFFLLFSGQGMIAISVVAPTMGRRVIMSLKFAHFNGFHHSSLHSELQCP